MSQDGIVIQHQVIKRVWRYQREVFRIRKSRTDNTMAKRKKYKGTNNDQNIHI